jgi:hypothetical protein
MTLLLHSKEEKIENPTHKTKDDAWVKKKKNQGTRVPWYLLGVLTDHSVPKDEVAHRCTHGSKGEVLDLAPSDPHSCGWWTPCLSIQYIPKQQTSHIQMEHFHTRKTRIPVYSCWESQIILIQEVYIRKTIQTFFLLHWHIYILYKQKTKSIDFTIYPRQQA